MVWKKRIKEYLAKHELLKTKTIRKGLKEIWKNDLWTIVGESALPYRYFKRSITGHYVYQIIKRYRLR